MYVGGSKKRIFVLFFFRISVHFYYMRIRLENVDISFKMKRIGNTINFKTLYTLCYHRPHIWYSQVEDENY